MNKTHLFALLLQCLFHVPKLLNIVFKVDLFVFGVRPLCFHIDDFLLKFCYFGFEGVALHFGGVFGCLRRLQLLNALLCVVPLRLQLGFDHSKLLVVILELLLEVV